MFCFCGIFGLLSSETETDIWLGLGPVLRLGLGLSLSMIYGIDILDLIAWWVGVRIYDETAVLAGKKADLVERVEEWFENKS